MASTLKVDNIIATDGTTAPITLSGDTATLGSGLGFLLLVIFCNVDQYGESPHCSSVGTNKYIFERNDSDSFEGIGSAMTNYIFAEFHA